MEKYIDNLILFGEGCRLTIACTILTPIFISLVLAEIYFLYKLAILIYRKYKKHFTECSLIFRVNKELESNNNYSFFRRVLIPFEQVYLPSRQSFLVLMTISIALALLGHQKIPSHILGIELGLVDRFHSLTGDDYQNFIAVSAGVGTVIFALIIFVAESLREDSEKARVLLKESFLYPVTVLSITTLLMHLWLDVTAMSLVVIVLIAFLAIFSLSRIIRLLLSPSLFLKKEQSLFRDKVKKSIDRALKLRVGNNVFLKKLEDDQFNVDYSIFSEDKEGFITIKHPDFGVIVDIDLCAIDILFEKLEELANKQDLSFRITKSQDIVDEKSLSVSDDFTETEKKKKAPVKGYLMKKLGDELNGERHDILVVPKKLVESGKVEKELQRLTKGIFIVSDKPEESLSEQLRIELNRKKDTAIESIRAGKIAKLDEIADLYISVAESFLEVIKIAGGGYSQTDAKKERGAIVGGWDEVRWISKDLYVLLNESVKTGDFEAIETLSHVPIAISVRSIKASDHFVFQEFVQFQVAIYRLAKESSNQKTQDYLIDRSWRFLKEMADFYIEAELDKKKNSAKDLENFIDFGVDILHVFQTLLKQAYTYKDTKSFDSFISTVAKIFHRFKPSEEYPDSGDLKRFLEKREMADSERVEMQEQYDRQLVLEKLENSIKQRKKELFWGISAWILEQYRQGEFNDESIGKFWEIVNRHLPNDIKELIEVYETTHSFAVEGFWGWDWWEMEGQEEGVAHSIDVSGKFDWLFCVKALNAVKNLTAEQIKAIKIEPKRDLVYLFEKDDSPVKSRLNQIAQNQALWSKVIPTESFTMIDDLKSLLDSIVNQQEKKEEDLLISSTLDDGRVSDFYTEFKSAFFRGVGLRKFFQREASFKELKKATKKEVTQWGFNQIDDKAVFIKGWHVSYSDWGKHYGEELADAEDSRLFHEIKTNATQVTPQNVDVIQKIQLTIQELKNKGFTPTLILSTVFPSDFYRSDNQLGLFIPHYQVEHSKFKSISGFIGLFKDGRRQIPVMQVRPRQDDVKDTVCVIDLSRFASLVQYPPYSNESEKQYVRDIFIFRIIDLNQDEALRKNIITKNPSWIAKYPDPDRYLSQKVVLNILERFELRIESKEAGVYFEIASD